MKNYITAIRSIKHLGRLLGKLGIRSLQRHYIAQADFGTEGGPRISYGFTAVKADGFCNRRFKNGVEEEVS